METIGIREAARRLGVRRAAVQKRIKGGTITARSDGKLDWATVKRQWAENRDESKVRKPEVVATVEPAPTQRFSGGERSFSAAKTKCEYIRLEREALQLRRLKGELAPIGEINAFVAGSIIRARDILLRIGPELKDRLAQQNSPRECERMIAAEVQRALHELREFRPTVS